MMRIAAILTSALLMISSGELSCAQPVQTDSGLFAPAGECVTVRRNLVGIVMLAGVSNKCDQAFTVVIYTQRGSEVINVPPHFQAEWNTTAFSRWKVCQGISNTSC